MVVVVVVVEVVVVVVVEVVVVVVVVVVLLVKIVVDVEALVVFVEVGGSMLVAVVFVQFPPTYLKTSDDFVKLYVNMLPHHIGMGHILLGQEQWIGLKCQDLFEAVSVYPIGIVEPYLDLKNIYKSFFHLLYHLFSHL